MISHNHKCIFIHIRKAAGSSVRRMLGETNHLLSDGIMSPEWSDLVDNKYQEYFKFCIVRNPWDRFISGWKYCWATRGQSIKEVLENMPRKDLSYNVLNVDATSNSRENYLKGMLEKERRHQKLKVYKSLGYKGDVNKDKGINARSFRHEYMHITVPQHKYILSNGEFVVDFIGSLEAIDEDVAIIRKKLGLKAANIPVVNSAREGSRIDYRDYFDDDTRKIFYELFKTDVDILGYDFDSGPGVPPNIEIKK